MSQIKSMISEVSSVNDEIKRLNKQRLKLLKRKKELDSQIIEYLEKTEKKGVKYRGTSVITKGTRGRKKKKEKEQDATDVLKKYGILNSDKIMKELMEAMKGEKDQNTVLRISKYGD